MTREPVATKGHYSRWLWHWVCDRPGCKTVDTVTALKHHIPTPEDMQARGWFVARTWGDLCPACRETGHVPTDEPWGRA